MGMSRVILSTCHESLSDDYVLLLILRFGHLEVIESVCFSFLRVGRCSVTIVFLAFRVFSVIVFTPCNCL